MESYTTRKFKTLKKLQEEYWTLERRKYINIMQTELRYALTQIENNKAPGEDLILIEMMKTLRQPIRQKFVMYSTKVS